MARNPQFAFPIAGILKISASRSLVLTLIGEEDETASSD